MHDSDCDCWLCAALLSESSIGNSGSVERVPAERSLWAMARQSDAGVCPAASFQERFAARKAADLAQQAALAATKATGQLRDAHRKKSSSNGKSGDCTVTLLDGEREHGDNAKSACCLKQAEQHNSLQNTGSAPKHGNAPSQAALHVQALKEELAAAEATVLELRTYLADAERELLQEQQQLLEVVSL